MAARGLLLRSALAGLVFAGPGEMAGGATGALHYVGAVALRAKPIGAHSGWRQFCNGLDCIISWPRSRQRTLRTSSERLQIHVPAARTQPSSALLGRTRCWGLLWPDPLEVDSRRPALWTTPLVEWDWASATWTESFGRQSWLDPLHVHRPDCEPGRARIATGSAIRPPAIIWRVAARAEPDLRARGARLARPGRSSGTVLWHLGDEVKADRHHRAPNESRSRTAEKTIPQTQKEY